MSARIDRMFEIVGSTMTDLERLFTKDAKLTFIARFDDNPEADVFISIDDPEKVAELVARTCARQRGERKHFHMGADVPGSPATAPGAAQEDQP